MNADPSSSTPPSSPTPLPLARLGLALLQAAALWGLHQSINSGQWPATSPGWLLSAYLVSVLLPLTLLVLAEHFLARFCRENGSALAGFTPAATALLLGHRWPGNVRELENALARAAILAEGDQVTAADLMLADDEPEAPASDAAFRTSGDLEDDEGPQGLPAPDLTPGTSLRDLLASFERAVLLRALDRTHYDVQQAAQLLGVDKRTLHNKLNLHRISRRRKRFE